MDSDVAPAGRRGRSVWLDPWRKLRTLESFARTEADGGRDIAAAARAVLDPELRGHLERHAADEERHAELFHRRAAELRNEVAQSPTLTSESERAYDLTRGRPSSEVDAHGFFKVGLIDELGEVSYVAMLHVAERKAAKLFARFERETASDPRTQEIFREILKDEKYHVAYTGRCLEQWKQRGRQTEVKEALRLARGSRFLGALRRTGLRSGAALGRLLMLGLYFTFLAPFGLMASRRAPAGGWTVQRGPAGSQSRGPAFLDRQY